MRLLREEHGALPRSINFVTGPSRSGDIEQTLQLGAHGPRRLCVLLVDEPAEARADGAMSRPRRPTAEELALWRRAMGGTAPLREGEAPPPPPAQPPASPAARPERRTGDDGPRARPPRWIRTGRSASTAAPGCA